MTTASMITERLAKESEFESNDSMYVFVYEAMELIVKYMEISFIVKRREAPWTLHPPLVGFRQWCVHNFKCEHTDIT